MLNISRIIASQLGKPSGIFANFAGLIWNRRNATLNNTVFDLLALRPTDRVLEIGFGGGYLLNRMMTVVNDGLAAGVMFHLQ